jgi:hypothetical protein
MVTIKTIATITEDGTITAKAPASAPRGKHRAVIVLEEAPVEKERPAVGRGFPDLAPFRQKLGVAPHPGNTIIEMREDERS